MMWFEGVWATVHEIDISNLKTKKVADKEKFNKSREQKPYFQKS